MHKLCMHARMNSDLMYMMYTIKVNSTDENVYCYGNEVDNVVLLCVLVK